MCQCAVQSSGAGAWREPRTNDEGNHGGSISSGGLEALDQLLDLPDLDLSTAAVSAIGARGLGIAKCLSFVLRPSHRGAARPAQRGAQARGGKHFFGAGVLAPGAATHVPLGLVRLSVAHFGSASRGLASKIFGVSSGVEERISEARGGDEGVR